MHVPRQGVYVNPAQGLPDRLGFVICAIRSFGDSGPHRLDGNTQLTLATMEGMEGALRWGERLTRC